MRIIITEEQKKKLFTPKGLSNDENNRYLKLNKERPIKSINGKEIRINQYDSDGEKQGYWEEYYENGNIEYEGSYVNGLRDGMWKFFHQTGGLFKEVRYDNGSLNGIWKSYHNNGELRFKGNYVNGEKEGVWVSYYYMSSKQFKREFLYKNNVMIKTITESYLKEVSIGKKEKLGSGSFHDVYPLKYDSSKVIKIPRKNSDYATNEYKVGGSDAWFNIFKKYPEYFPKVYKITDKYVILEKLDTNKVKSEISEMEDDMILLSPSIGEMIEVKNYGVTEILDSLVLGKLSGVSEDIKMLNTLTKKSNKKDLFKKYIDLLVSIRGSRVRGFIDVNDVNFGYDSEGKLKMLDI